MTDWFHKVVKYLDHNRWTVAGFSVAVFLFAAVGCATSDGKITSSQSGNEVNAAQREAELMAELSALEKSIAENRLVIAEASARIEASAQTALALNEDFELDMERIAEEIRQRNALIDKTVGIIRPYVQQIPAGESILDLLLLAGGVGGSAVAVGMKRDNRRKDRIIAAAKQDTKA